MITASHLKVITFDERLGSGIPGILTSEYTKHGASSSSWVNSAEARQEEDKYKTEFELYSTYCSGWMFK